MIEEVNLGTSIIAITFNSGVILAADSRTTTGSYIANRVSDKLTPLHSHIYCCRSGSAADTQALADAVAYQLGLLAVAEGRGPGRVPVRWAAKLLQGMCYENKEQLSAGLIVAGWGELPRRNGQVGGGDIEGSADDVINVEASIVDNPRGESGRLYGPEVYNIPLGGSLHKQPFAIGGSGSAYIYGWCDANWRDGMTREEGETFVVNALTLAMSRDGSSGGVIRMAVITKDGVERKVVPPAQQPVFWQG